MLKLLFEKCNKDFKVFYANNINEWCFHYNESYQNVLQIQKDRPQFIDEDEMDIFMSKYFKKSKIKDINVIKNLIKTFLIKKQVFIVNFKINKKKYFINEIPYSTMNENVMITSQWVIINHTLTTKQNYFAIELKQNALFPKQSNQICYNYIKFEDLENESNHFKYCIKTYYELTYDHRVLTDRQTNNCYRKDIIFLKFIPKKYINTKKLKISVFSSLK